MKKNALMILLAGLISFGAFAQDRKENRKRGGEKPTPEKRAEWQTNNMKEKVGLNDDQYKKLYAINLEEAKKNEKKAVERRENFKKERAELNKKYASVLTPDQLKKLEESKAHKPHRGKGDFKKRGAKRVDENKGK